MKCEAQIAEGKPTRYVNPNFQPFWSEREAARGYHACGLEPTIQTEIGGSPDGNAYSWTLALCEAHVAAYTRMRSTGSSGSSAGQAGR